MNGCSPEICSAPSQGSDRLILFSGLAANSDVFALQMLAFPMLIVPDWPKPQARDTLQSYSDRLAESLKMEGELILGGASFGGIVALHAARLLRPRAVMLIGSVKSPAELSHLIRFCRPLRAIVPLIPVRLIQWLATPFTSRRVSSVCPHLSRLLCQFIDSDPVVFKWSLARILDWKQIPVLDCPIYHIHGDRDRVLPIRYTNPNSVVIGGGHVISLTHPDQVNAFIQSVIDRTNN